MYMARATMRVRTALTAKMAFIKPMWTSAPRTRNGSAAFLRLMLRQCEGDTRVAKLTACHLAVPPGGDHNVLAPSLPGTVSHRWGHRRRGQSPLPQLATRL